MQANIQNESNIKIQNFKKSALVKYFVRNSGILIGFVVLCAFFGIFSSAFFTTNNILNILRQISINAIIAFGMTFVILIAGIDLSVGSVVALTGTITAGLIANGVNMIVALLVGLILGCAVGFANGFFVAKGHVPSFIVTLAMMTIVRGFAYVYSDGRPVRVDNAKFSDIGNGYFGPIPIPVVLMIVLLAVSAILLGRTRFGRYVYAIGGNREAAKFSGINIVKVELLSYTICGFLAGLSGIVLAARMYSGQPIAGNGFELDAIAAVVVGGTSLSGGVGTLGGTIIGALIIGVLNNGLNLIHVPFYWQLIVKGAVILTAVYVDMLKKSKSTTN